MKKKKKAKVTACKKPLASLAALERYVATMAYLAQNQQFIVLIANPHDDVRKNIYIPLFV